MRRTFAITAVLFLFSALFFVFVCAAGSMDVNSEAAALVKKPWKGHWIGNMYIVGYCPDGSLQVLDIGKGFATHMGASKWIATICLNPITGLGEGKAVITGANGDAVYLAISIRSHGIGGPNGTWYETETVTGGTGRFADATGSGTSNGSWVATSETSFSWVGVSDGKLMY
jgi:hypothetical protein